MVTCAESAVFKIMQLTNLAHKLGNDLTIVKIWEIFEEEMKKLSTKNWWQH